MKKRIRIQVDKKKHGEFFNWVRRIKNRIKNRGTGAGGANTNANGLSYEALTMLPYHIIEEEENHMKIKFHGCDKTFICANQCKFYKYMDSIGVIKKKQYEKLMVVISLMNVILTMLEILFSSLKRNFNKVLDRSVKKSKHPFLKHGYLKKHFQTIPLSICIAFRIGFVVIAKPS